MIINALEGKQLPVYGDGQQIRDWLYVDDHARALHLVATKGTIGETYNIGGRDEKANIDVITVDSLTINGWSEGAKVSLAELFTPRETADSKNPDPARESSWSMAIEKMTVSNSQLNWRSEFLERSTARLFYLMMHW